jgi:hypothetical protein
VPVDCPSVRWCVKGELHLLGELWQNCEKVGIKAVMVGINGKMVGMYAEKVGINAELVGIRSS